MYFFQTFYFFLLLTHRDMVGVEEGVMGVSDGGLGGVGGVAGVCGECGGARVWESRSRG